MYKENLKKSEWTIQSNIKQCVLGTNQIKNTTQKTKKMSNTDPTKTGINSY